MRRGHRHGAVCAKPSRKPGLRTARDRGANACPYRIPNRYAKHPHPNSDTSQFSSRGRVTYTPPHAAIGVCYNPRQCDSQRYEWRLAWVPPASWIRSGGRLYLPNSPFLLCQLKLATNSRYALDHDRGVLVDPPNLAELCAFPRRTPTRDPGVTAPTAGAATHAAEPAPNRNHRPVPVGPALSRLVGMANAARDRQA
jgi:hypothetical protein